MYKGRVVDLAELRMEDTEYGSKAANQGELHTLGFYVPSGMVIHPDCPIANALPKLTQRFNPAYRYSPSPNLIVRSSGLAEDGVTASYAGQHLTVFNQSVERLEELGAAIQACRDSGKDATAYREAKGEKEQPIAVIVQRQLESHVSGVLFTADPVNNDLNTMVCEWVNGMGEALVSGTTNPDGSWEWHLGANQPHNLIGDQDPLLNKSLNESARRIIKHFKRPMDIEWVQVEGIVHLVQARPLTLAQNWGGTMDGISACKGVVTGVGDWLDDSDTTKVQNFDEDHLLLAYMTTPKMVPAIIKAGGFATAIGGRTCHAAIVAREIQKPCVVGVASLIAMPGGQTITIDGDKGQVTVNE